ncbi:Hint domain-containing protein [uncultured Tateyamaria sp.]|uniref:Hint domain-containing protein n=1 Tax=uncultured Tateyamaria sp. TaxID=455651 RepID=UPI002633F3E4|nr:Hint domain-containing protein [uncultured Tateyamaria sp.]
MAQGECCCVIWTGLCDHQNGRYAPSGLGIQRANAPAREAMTRGTLMFETNMAGHVRPHDLLGVAHPVPWARELIFRAIPGGGIAMVHRHNDTINHAAIRWTGDGRAHTLRVTYAWDTSKDWARLALEQPERAQVVSNTVHAPNPLLAQDMRDLMLGRGAHTLSREVLFAAISPDIFPIGPTPSLHPATPIATPNGYRPAETLRRGDTVMTAVGDIVPVLHTVRQSVPARGSFRPVRLQAPYFGLARDIVVSPEQRLVLRGSDVEYIFGQEAVLVPARHMVNGHAAIWAAPQTTADYVQILLPGHEALVAAGCALESLYIGRLRRNERDLSASILADMPSRLLPEHAKPIHQVLRQFEAITLVEQRAA